VPWARPGSGFTLLFEAMVLLMCQQMPVAGVAKRCRPTPTRYGASVMKLVRMIWMLSTPVTEIGETDYPSFLKLSLILSFPVISTSAT
jgi:hypothetical protein